MSIAATGKEVVNNFIKPKNLIVGMLVTVGTLWILKNITPGLGAIAGLRTNGGMVPIPFWPFQSSMTPMGSPTSASTSSDNSLDLAFWRANGI